MSATLSANETRAAAANRRSWVTGQWIAQDLGMADAEPTRRLVALLNDCGSWAALAPGMRRTDVHEILITLATGLLLRLHAQVAAHCADGFAGDESDDTLEAWAGWRFEPGKFAQWIRQNYVDEQGVVIGWHALQRPWEDLQLRRQKARNKKYDQRMKARLANAGGPGDSPGEVAEDEPGDLPTESPGDRPREDIKDRLADAVSTGQIQHSTGASSSIRPPRPYSPDFERWWRIHPPRDGADNKRAAWNAWLATIKRHGATIITEIMEGTARYSESLRRTGEKAKMGSTFLGPDEHWRDRYERPGAIAIGVDAAADAARIRAEIRADRLAAGVQP
jgi:hypothetical protein